MKGLPQNIITYMPHQGPSHLPTPVVESKPLLGFLPHPERSAPACPPRPKLPPPPAGWTSSLHASPAAYPKGVPEAHGSLSRESHPYEKGPIPAKETKEERNKRLFEETTRCIDLNDYSEEWTLEEAKKKVPKAQWLCVERWRRDKPVGGATLVVTHANGLLKEQWHPVLLDILTRDPKSPGTKFGTGLPLPATNVLIDDVWMIDDMNSNMSVDLNGGLLGPVQLWTDDSRDFLNFVRHVLPGARALGDTPAPWHLQWNEAPSAAAPVIGVGHSFGSNGLVQASNEYPGLFAGLFLVDPMCPGRAVPRGSGPAAYELSAGALKRRIEWPSRDAARKLMQPSPFYGTWDDAAFDIWMTHGIIPVDYSKPDGAVTLATPSWCEAAIFCDPKGYARGWDKLPRLPFPVGFLMANKPVATLGEVMTNEMVWRPPLARVEKITDAGHLITQEKPHATADALWRFLTTLNSGEWGTSPEEIRKEWTAVWRKESAKL